MSGKNYAGVLVSRVIRNLIHGKQGFLNQGGDDDQSEIFRVWDRMEIAWIEVCKANGLKVSTDKGQGDVVRRGRRPL